MTDHPLPFSPDDPRLSAYLLGEMEAGDLQAFEAELKAHPEAQQLLEELRETSALVEEALAEEPAPALSAAQRSEILSAAATAHTPVSKETPIMKKSHRLATWGLVAAVAALSLVAAVLFKGGNDSPGNAQYFSDAEAPSSAENEKRIGYDEENEGIVSHHDTSNSLNLPALDDWPKNGTVAGLAPPGELHSESKTRLFPGEPRETPPGQKQAPPKPASPRYAISGLDPAKDPLRAGGRLGEMQWGLAALEAAPAKREITRRKIAKSLPPGFQAAQNFEADFKGQPVPGGFANETYEPIFENAFIVPRDEQALSTFSIDVDTASYSNVRRFIQHGQRPPADAVRIEELVNYFHYDYAPPDGKDPFAVHTEVAVCPWKPAHHLVRIGLKGREITKEQRPLSNLVFLIDVSGSMSSVNKLPLVKTALTMLAGEMNENDRISIVTYASSAAVRLPSTSGEYKSDIISAIQNLSAGGSTNGEGGIHLAYTEAIRNYIEDGSNRVILCTDGDFNVGVSDDDELVRLIQDKAKNSGVFLSVFGFGMGNLKDAKLEKLADKGNGHYAYIDSQREARKVFVEELTGTLYTIAKDVKIQVEFNPAHVGAYRLIGYENRVLAARDFNDDTKDAGEIGAGHTVTALYEVIPKDKMPAVAEGVDRLKYQPVPKTEENPSPDLLTLKLRFKQPDEDASVKREYPIAPPKKKAQHSRETEWQAAVAAFGMVLRNSKHKGQADLKLVRELALGSRGPDPTGQRREFIDLVLTAEKLAKGEPLQPAQLPQQMAEEDAQKAASVQGKYQNLLKTLSAPQDVGVYGAFHDFGYWEGQTYGDHQDLPKAYWVYVYPNWYLWETVKE